MVAPPVLSIKRVTVKLSLTAQCILCLLLGILAGSAASGLQPDALSPWLSVGDAAIQMWTNALRLVVLPLVVAQLFVAIAAHRGTSGEATKLGFLIPAVFVGLFAFTALLAIALGSSLLSLPVFANLQLSSAVAVEPVASGAAAGGAAPFSWLTDLVPSNLFAAASAGAILPLMLFTLAFALAARHVAPPLLHALDTAFQAVLETMFVLVGWLMRVAPPILFALAFRSASQSGLGIGGALLAFVVIWAIVLVCCIAAQYPVAAIGAGLSISRFAHALFPAQVVAVASRSSVATVPVLLREAGATLDVPAKVSSLVIPAGAAILKLSQAVSPPLRLLFLASVLGISLEPRQLLIFMVTVVLMSPGIAGVPRMVSGAHSMPAYVAAGIPPEYVLLLTPLNAVVDVLLTLLNTTGYMTVNVLVARRVFGRFAARAEDSVPRGAAKQPVMR